MKNEIQIMKEQIIEVLGGNHTKPIEFTSVQNYGEVYGLYTYRRGIFVFKDGTDLEFDDLTTLEQTTVLKMVIGKKWKVNAALQ